MASRKYQRDSHGRFAGSGRAVSTTVGRAGGFANQPHREKAQTARRAAAKRRQRNTMLKRKATRAGATALGAALAGGGVRRVTGSRTLSVVAAISAGTSTYKRISQ